MRLSSNLDSVSMGQCANMGYLGV